MFQIAHERWKIFTQIFTDALAWLFSIIFYFTVMVPFGVGVRLFSDPLTLKGKTVWVEREPVGSTLEDARRQG